MHLSVNGAVYANGLRLGNRRPGCVRLVKRDSLLGASEGETCSGECLPWVPLEQWGMCISVWNGFCRAVDVKGWDWMETSGKTVPCWSSQGRGTSDQHLSSSWDVPITVLGALFTYLFMSFNPQGNFWIQAVITPFNRRKNWGFRRTIAEGCWGGIVEFEPRVYARARSMTLAVALSHRTCFWVQGWTLILGRPGFKSLSLTTWMTFDK